MTQILHFSISPVQSFIVQSRRTRDLWSSSFLLSWLTGIAMSEVLSAGGTILFPSVQNGNKEISDDLLRAIRSDTDKVPFIGTLPNRFKAQVPADFDPKRCTEAVQTKWAALATAVKTQFLPLDELHRSGLLFVPKKKRQNPNSQNKSQTETVWDQQVKSFWDIRWVKGIEPAKAGDAHWLNLRKNWHQHIQPDQQEPGDACTLMPGWVELSGHLRSRSEEFRKQQDSFWEVVRGQVSKGHREVDAENPGPGSLNLRPDERLCAIAFVKRLWPKLPKSEIKRVLGWVPDDKTKSAGNWPSTAYMAALPWVEATYKSGDATQKARCDDYVSSLQTALLKGAGEREGLFSETLNQIAGIEEREHFFTLDGQLFFKDGLAAAAKEGLLQQSKIADLQKQLEQIAPQTEASPFFAVLRMDGDSVGKLIGEAGKANEVSKALAAFANQVRSIVDTRNQGATLYAGGDDVLALLPLDTAIACATRLQQAYQAAMQANGLGGTISAAIVFAHYHLPLSFIMTESTRLLVDVAKTQNNRNSVAVAVHKPGGLHLTWVSCWDASGADSQQPNNNQPLQTLLGLVEKFNPKSAAASTARPLSSGFLYRIRERWGDLTSPNEQGRRALQFSQKHVEQLWAADLLANRDLGEINDTTRELANSLASQLFAVSRDNRNPIAAPTPPQPPMSPANIFLSENGGLLVRFLATKGVRL